MSIEGYKPQHLDSSAEHMKAAPVDHVVKTDIVLDDLLEAFHASVYEVSRDPQKKGDLLSVLQDVNPQYIPFEVSGKYPETDVICNVVGAVYAPLIHAYAQSIVTHIGSGILPPVVVAPPRDAIPLACAIQSHADMQAVDVNIVKPHVNRNTAGIHNNQRAEQVGRSPFLDLHIQQMVASMKGSTGAVEVEPGIYGTTSMVLAAELKKQGLETYVPVKFYGLGPNMSFVHAVLSGGASWVAEDAEKHSGFPAQTAEDVMVLLDTMEELGMEKFFQSVEELTIDESGIVVPVIRPVNDKDHEIAVATNHVIKATAGQYEHFGAEGAQQLLSHVGDLVALSQQGFPITLSQPIPSMDNKAEHYKKVRESGLFDYPELVLS